MWSSSFIPVGCLVLGSAQALTLPGLPLLSSSNISSIVIVNSTNATVSYDDFDPECDAAYGTEVNQDSCLNALDSIKLVTRFHPYRNYHHFYTPLNSEPLLYRFLSNDGLCAIDLRYALNNKHPATEDYLDDPTMLMGAFNIINKCVKKRKRGGRIRHRKWPLLRDYKIRVVSHLRCTCYTPCLL